jgi:hypothetical protein
LRRVTLAGAFVRVEHELDAPDLVGYETYVELGGAARMPFASAIFDVVVLEDQVLSLGEVVRVLRTGGLLLAPAGCVQPGSWGLTLSKTHSVPVALTAHVKEARPPAPGWRS